MISWQWKESEAKLLYRESGNELLKNGKAPEEGDLIKLTTLAESMNEISQKGPSAIYGGSLGEKIASFISQEEGWLDIEDLKNLERRQIGAA